MKNPVIIQGGMGVGVSNWRLARAVSKEGQLGVVSGTILDTVFVRRLQDGDPGGHMRHACAHFPDQNMAQRVVERYYIEGGKAEGQPYKQQPMFSVNSSRDLLELTIVANFAEVFLAKEGHSGVVGINLLEKIQLPTVPSLYGAMLGGVDYVLMGAGIPKAIPGILDGLSRQEPVTLKLNVVSDDGSDAPECTIPFDPREFLPHIKSLKRPKFLAVVSSHALALNLIKKASGKVDGFVVENHTAGGHNAPPRGTMTLSEAGEPVYGERDRPDLAAMAKLGVPFWLAGSYAKPEKLKEALDAGAAGVQLGTAFAYCEESGIADDLKLAAIEKAVRGQAKVFTDPVASACGYPFKVVQLEGTLSEPELYDDRKRICDLGYLRTAYKRKDGSIGFRCPGEPEDDYVKKGGKFEDTVNRKCLCNGLVATIGHGQMRAQEYEEPALVTAGSELSEIWRYLPANAGTYTAKHVIDYVLCGACTPV